MSVFCLRVPFGTKRPSRNKVNTVVSNLNFLKVIINFYWGKNTSRKHFEKTNAPRPHTIISFVIHLILLFCQLDNLSSLWIYIFLVQVWIWTEVLQTPSSTQPGFESRTSRSWQCISCIWDACSNHSAINDFSRLMHLNCSW